MSHLRAFLWLMVGMVQEDGGHVREGSVWWICEGRGTARSTIGGRTLPMDEGDNASAVLRTERVLRASPREVFAAFARPECLARWWGPKGFTNTFQEFDFRTGGRWVFVMHGPNGVDYPNESVFQKIEPDREIVIEDVVQLRFTLTVTLTARGEQTHLAWAQAFESAEVAARLRAVCEPANEQNLDRLEAVLSGR